MLIGLLSDLRRALEFDGLSLEEQRAADHCVLLFRNGSRRVIRIKLVGQGDRCVVEIGGNDPKFASHCVTVCREHFDCWFGVPAEGGMRRSRAAIRKGRQ